MSSNNAAKIKAFQELDSLSDKFTPVYQQLRNIQDRMKHCIELLDWGNDMDLLREIINHVPKESYLSFRLYDRLFTLQQRGENDSELDGGDKLPSVLCKIRSKQKAPKPPHEPKPEQGRKKREPEL